MDCTNPPPVDIPNLAEKQLGTEHISMIYQVMNQVDNKAMSRSNEEVRASLNRALVYTLKTV